MCDVLYRLLGRTYTTMSQHRLIAGRCSSTSSSSAAAAAVPCIHRPFEDPPHSSTCTRHGGGPPSAYPDSTGGTVPLPRATAGRGKAASTDLVVDGGALRRLSSNSLQVRQDLHGEHGGIFSGWNPTKNVEHTQKNVKPKFQRCGVPTLARFVKLINKDQSNLAKGGIPSGGKSI